MFKILVDEEWDLDGSRVIDAEMEADDVWLDIETRKVPAPEGWPYRMRWQPFMVAMCGASDPGVFWAEVAIGDEDELIAYLRDVLGGGRVVRYAGTREFDEMVLRGRFTNARRAHSPVAGPWPNLDGDDVEWLNVRKQLRPVERSADCASRDVPELWARGEREVVTRHCLRDALGMALGDPDAELSASLRAALEAEMV